MEENEDNSLLQKLLRRKKELLEIKSKITRCENVSHKEKSEDSQERSILQDITNTSDSLQDISPSVITLEKPKNVFIPSSSDSSNIINTSTVCLEMSNSFFHDSKSVVIPKVDQVTDCTSHNLKTSNASSKQKVTIISDINITGLDQKTKNELIRKSCRKKKQNYVSNSPGKVGMASNITEDLTDSLCNNSSGSHSVNYVPPGSSAKRNLHSWDTTAASNSQKMQKRKHKKTDLKLNSDEEIIFCDSERSSSFNTRSSDLNHSEVTEDSAKQMPPKKKSKKKGKNKKQISVDSADTSDNVIFLPKIASTPSKLITSDIGGGSNTLSDHITKIDLSVGESTAPFNAIHTSDLPAKYSTPGNEFSLSELPKEASAPLTVTGTSDLPGKCSPPGDEVAPSVTTNEASTPIDITGISDLPADCSTPGDEFAPSELPKEDRTPFNMAGLADSSDKYSTPCGEVAASVLQNEASTPLNITGTLDLPAKCTIPCNELSTPVLPGEASAALNIIGSSDLPVKGSGSSNKFLACVSPEKPSTSRQPKKRKLKKRRCKSFKKEYIDFLSDEEFNFPVEEDFSPGSSDVWSEKESDVSDSADSTNDRKKKKKRKKKEAVKTSEQNVDYKKKKKDNKKRTRKEKRAKGESYETFSGKMKESKRVQDNPCKPEKCHRACYEVSEDRRQKVFDYFWNLDIQRKRDWLVQCCSRVPIKRKKTKLIESKRNWTFEYYINEGEGRRQVCQQFILKTLDITQTFLLYTIGNASEGLSQEDKRTRTAEKQYDEATTNFARKYIENLPLLPSHYCRKTSNRLYLPQEFKNATNLYRLYRKWCEERNEKYLSERIFLNMFRTEYSNITVHVPKKDKCKICAKEENDPDTANKDSEILKAHIEEKKATYKRFRCHQQLNSIDKSTVVSSFDLQKVLNTPHGNDILLFYSRKYTVFNLTVYESSTQNGFCYTWGESEGKRGSKEIGSCLFKYLKNVDDRGFKKVILYCDSCPGQNKNKSILSILNYFLSISQNLEIVQINYLLPGHSYMPVDSMHSVIEREVRKLTVWSYTQWPTYMESARKNPRPYAVEVLDHKDFIDWDSVVKKVFSSSTNLHVSKIRIATLKKKDLSIIKVKDSMKVEATTREILVNKKIQPGNKEPVQNKTKIEKNNRGRWKGKGKGKGSSTCIDVVSTSWAETEENRNDVLTLQPLYKNSLPISSIKYKNLKTLCDDGVIPKRFHADFLKLHYSAIKKDTLMETDVEDNFDDN